MRVHRATRTGQRAMRTGQRGSAMLITLVLIAALLAGAAVLVQLQISSTRSSDLTRTGTRSNFCAEAGLALARPIVLAQYTQWAPALQQSNTALLGGTAPVEPSFLTTGLGTAHDLDGDGVGDFIVYLKDNDDEGTATNDRAVDNDLSVFIVSKCIRYPEIPREVEELVQFTGSGTCYQAQQGGCGGNNNSN